MGARTLVLGGHHSWREWSHECVTTWFLSGTSLRCGLWILGPLESCRPLSAPERLAMLAQ